MGRQTHKKYEMPIWIAHFIFLKFEISTVWCQDNSISSLEAFIRFSLGTAHHLCLIGIQSWSNVQCRSSNIPLFFRFLCIRKLLNVVSIKNKREL